MYRILLLCLLPVLLQSQNRPTVSIGSYYDFDVTVSPSFGGNQLLTTNLTGHPCLVLPNGFNSRGTPTSISFLGKLYGEAALVTIGRAYQEATQWEDIHPRGF